MPSSVIDHFSYDADKKLLKVTFITGMVYLYQNVPNKHYKMLKVASSKGRYFNRYIKGYYTFKKFEDA